MHKRFTQYLPYILTALLLLCLGTGGYLFYQGQQMKLQIQGLLSEKTELQSLVDSTAKSLAGTQEQLALVSEELSKANEDLDDTEDDLRKEKDKNGQFEDQISSLVGTVGDLDKLSKTDKELLQKYSKVYFLNENYVPSNIKQIDDDYILEGKDSQFFHKSALSFLEEMLEDAEDDDIDLKIISAYRSFDHQTELKGQFTQVYGNGANTFSADQGYSEHQLGTTLDLTTPAIAGTYESFAQTEAYEWLQKNAYKYGFILSYPEDNGFYIFEPWHWRFVGTDLAKDLHRADANFYDWEQRKIDEYLLKIFD